MVEKKDIENCFAKDINYKLIGTIILKEGHSFLRANTVEKWC